MTKIIKNLDLKQISALEIVENKSFKSPLGTKQKRKEESDYTSTNNQITTPKSKKSTR